MIRYLIAAACAFALGACAPQPNRDARVPIGPLATVDWERYSGLWYEIARFPDGARPCSATTSDLRIRPDTRIEVIETCLEGGLDGEERVRVDVARIVDASTNAKLRIRGSWFLERDYWVLDRAEDYSWALVGEPEGRYLWIYAREPAISDPLKRDLVAKLQARGYRTEALSWTEQDQTKGRARRTFARDAGDLAP
jgi:apolipoprotein D and lipocalin family protein